MKDSNKIQSLKTISIPVIQKILKMKKGRDGEKVNKQDGMR